MRDLNRSNLSEQQRRAVAEFFQRVSDQFPVSEVTLYGSYARGEGTSDSDIDMLVVLECPVTRNIREVIYDVAFEVNLEYDTVISVLIVDSESWNNGLLSVSPIHMAVQRDGIRL